MRTPFLVGETIYLRPLDGDDLNDAYLGWLNNPDVTRYLETGFFPTTREGLNAFYAAVGADPNQVLLAIVDRETDRHVGNIKLGPVNWVHRKATLGILIGEREFWGRGIARAATRLVVEYGFEKLNLHRIDLGVYAEHHAAIKVYESVGFVVEGRFREDLFQDGQYRDRLWMGLLRTDYRRTKENC